MAEKNLPKNLTDNRKEIDQIDQKLLNLIHERSKLVVNAGKIKKKSGEKTFYRPDREASLIKTLQKKNKSSIPAENIKFIFKEIISACFTLEKKIKVYYLGPRGTFSEIATTMHFGSSVETVETENIRNILIKVSKNKNSYGILPFENSIEGMVNQSLDSLIESDLKICSELELPIEHCLISSEKNIKKINTVYGHQQAIAQCRNWLSANLPRVKIVEAESSARAAQLVKNKSGKGSIGPKKISEIYSLNLLKEKIQDQKNNTTRFLVIGNEFPDKTSDDKTSLSLSLKNEQGALLKVLQIINKNKINLTNILSRPVKKNKWQYSFFLEFSGHASDKNVLKLFKELQKVSTDLKFLGSYPTAY
tara:strand:+ start:32 stop:1120 length:1089 start_codon:yes stop_codon:yes gene_type:complete